MLCVPQFTEHPSRNCQGIKIHHQWKRHYFRSHFYQQLFKDKRNIVKVYHEHCNSIEAIHLKVTSSEASSHDSPWWSEHSFRFGGGAGWGSSVRVISNVAGSYQHCCFPITRHRFTAPNQANPHLWEESFSSWANPVLDFLLCSIFLGTIKIPHDPTRNWEVYFHTLKKVKA